MPLRAAQILLRAGSPEALGELVERALRRQKPAPGAARSLLALQLDEWGCVLERGRVDGGLARLLSEGASGEVIALELDGSRFALKLRRFAAGEPRAQIQEPADVATGLPLVRDVEQLAWDELCALGVPPAFRLCGADDVTLLGPDDDGVHGFRFEAGAPGVTRVAVRAVPPERRDGPQPPAQPDSVVASKAGETRALEVRLLPGGAPDAAAAAALAAVEETAAYRLCLQLGRETEEARLPRPAFAYRCERLGELLPLLEQARAERPWLSRLLDPAIPPPLSHDGFSERARALLAAALPEAPVARAHGLFLELPHPGAPGRSLKLALLPRWLAALRGEEPEPDPAAPDASGPLLAEARSLLALPAGPVAGWPPDAIARSLLPVLVSAAGAGQHATVPFAGGLRLGLLCDDGDQLAPVDGGALEAAGLDFEQALARGLENADALTVRAPHGLLWFDLEHGRVAMTDYDDPAGAGRLASPFFRSLLLQLLGGFCLAAAPTRDSLLACAPESREAVDWLREEAARRFREGPFPLDPGLFEVTEEVVAELLEDPLSLKV